MANILNPNEMQYFIGYPAQTEEDLSIISRPYSTAELAIDNIVIMGKLHREKFILLKTVGYVEPRDGGVALIQEHSSTFYAEDDDDDQR